MLLVILVSLIFFGAAKAHKMLDKDSPANKPTLGTVFIDPGHGGNDPGAESNGRVEKEDTLRMGLMVRDELKKKGYKVKMSRTDDESVDRGLRADMANEAQADLMVSIHRNQATSGEGVEIWIPSANGEKDRSLGDNIMKALENVGISQNRNVRSGTLVDPNDDYVENANSLMPSCLIELGFLSSDTDNKDFDKKGKKYAKAIAYGIHQTYEKIYK